MNEVLVFVKRSLLLIVTVITFVKGNGLFDMFVPIYRHFPSEPSLWCPQMNRNLCDPVKSFKGRMTELRQTVKHREIYKENLRHIEKKIDEIHEPVRRHDNGGRSDSSTQVVENVNNLRSEVGDLEKETKDVLSFLTDNEFDSNSKNTQDSSTSLKDEFQGVVKLEEIGKLEDRMIKLEEKMSKISPSNTLDAIKHMDNLLENTIKKFTSKIQGLDAIERELNKVDTIKNQLNFFNKSVTRTTQNFQALVEKAKDTYISKYQNFQKNYHNWTNIQSSLVAEKFEKNLDNFIDDWIKNCSHIEDPCLAFTEKQLKLLKNPHAEYSNTLLENVAPQVLSSLFWGCSPIIPETFPNVIIRRHSLEKMVTFSCAKNEVLIGPRLKKCNNRKWRPSGKPVCKSRFTYVSIPSCPEIKIDENSSLIYRINENLQNVQFECPEGQALRGPSIFWCRKGSWYPRVDQISECYTL